MSPSDVDEGLADGYFPDVDTTDVVDLRTGAPDKGQLREVKDIFCRAAQEHSRLPRADRLFQYGPMRGPPRFTRELATFLNAGYASALSPVRPAGLLATAGATSGLWLVTSVLLSRRAVVFVESPTYFIATHILRSDLGHRLVPVPMEKDGVDVDVLDRKVAAEKEQMHLRGEDCEEGSSNGHKRFWAMFYTIPTFHNPTGVCVSPAKSSRIVDTARRHDLLVLCDDVYNLLCNDGGTPPERLLAYADGHDGESGLGNVVSNGSFSKLLGPGLRLGWLEACPALIDRLADGTGLLRSSGCMNNAAAGIITAALGLGLVRDHVRHLRDDVYADRFDAVYRVLRQFVLTGKIGVVVQSWVESWIGNRYFFPLLSFSVRKLILPLVAINIR